LENEGQSLLGVNRMLNDKEFRKFIVSNVKDPSVRSFWDEEYAKAGDKYQQEAAPGIQNKIGQFIANPLIRNIIGQERTSFDLRDIMDNKKILIVNLSKGKVGEGNADLIGSLLITKIYLAAMSRADAGPYELEKLPPFYFYVDEFQNFANESFGSILSESRKYNLALTVAHQYIEQMEDEVKAAVFGNVGTMITFRVGATDAEAFEKEFAPYFTMDDIVNLDAFQVYLRLMIDGVGSKPFSAHTLDPMQRPAVSHADAVIAHSRATYGKPVFDVTEEVVEFYKPKGIKPAEKKADESVVRVREIRDDTPLPAKKDDRPPRRNERSGERRTSERRTDERRGGARSDEHVRSQQAQDPQMRQPQTFDEKPVVSLKDALAKALQEREASKASPAHIQERREETKEEKMKREVDEATLRKLISDE
jgi:hypothetical protein